MLVPNQGCWFTGLQLLVKNKQTSNWNSQNLVSVCRFPNSFLESLQCWLSIPTLPFYLPPTLFTPPCSIFPQSPPLHTTLSSIPYPWLLTTFLPSVTCQFKYPGEASQSGPTYERTCRVYLSRTGLPCSEWLCPAPFISLQTSVFYSAVWYPIV